MTMTTPALTKAQFLKGVAHHVMHIERDDGLYRHLRFRRDGSSCLSFSLITYPGGLLYRGDMGTFVFERLADMFEFFRTDGGDINPGYWSSKLTAVDNRRSSPGPREFSDAKFVRNVKEYVLRWCRDNADITTKTDRRELWDEVLEDVIGAEDNGHYKVDAAINFSHRMGPTTFHFVDFWDYTNTDYTYEFLWCCYALVWGIQQYDLAKAAATATAQPKGGAA